MPLKIAIIGRPNVGKSTLFNRLIGRKTAIVHDRPGVTRDRKEANAKFFDIDLILIDTAGYEQSTADNIESRMAKQTLRAVDEADVCLFLYDARAGLHPHDEMFADIVRQSGKPAILLANKCESKVQADGIFEAYKLGFGEPIIFSAEHGLGLNNLYTALRPFAKNLTQGQSMKEKPIQVAILGRPNVGKSTLVNALLKDERMLTGPEAGLTRDAVATHFSDQGYNFVLVDTAGLRRQSRVEGALERLAAADTKHAAAMAQVVVLVLDADAVLEKQDLTIARNIIDEGRALVIAINKWDIANKKEALERLNDKLQTSLTQVSGIPTVTISALKSEGLDKLIKAVIKVYELWNTRIPTAPLNQWFADVQEKNTTPLGKNKRRIKLKYITQAKTRPPSFYIFSSNPEGLPESYLRYLTNDLRETFGLDGIPIRMQVRKSENPYANKK